MRGAGKGMGYGRGGVGELGYGRGGAGEGRGVLGTDEGGAGVLSSLIRETEEGWMAARSMGMRQRALPLSWLRRRASFAVVRPDRECVTGLMEEMQSRTMRVVLVWLVCCIVLWRGPMV